MDSHVFEKKEDRERAMSACVLSASVAGDVRVDDILGKRRPQEYVTPRHVAAWMMRIYCGFTYEDIGRYMERDHSTIIYSIRKVGEMLQIGDKEYGDMLTKSMEEWNKVMSPHI